MLASLFELVSKVVEVVVFIIAWALNISAAICFLVGLLALWYEQYKIAKIDILYAIGAGLCGYYIHHGMWMNEEISLSYIPIGVYFLIYSFHVGRNIFLDPPLLWRTH